MQSRLSKQASSFNDDRAKNPQHADTAKMLKMAEPTIVPILILFPSVKKVPTHVIQNSGDEVAIVIKVAAANSCFMLNSKNEKKNPVICKEENNKFLYFDRKCECKR